jgi:hypothetical protein
VEITSQKVQDELRRRETRPPLPINMLCPLVNLEKCGRQSMGKVCLKCRTLTNLFQEWMERSEPDAHNPFLESVLNPIMVAVEKKFDAMYFQGLLEEWLSALSNSIAFSHNMPVTQVLKKLDSEALKLLMAVATLREYVEGLEQPPPSSVKKLQDDIKDFLEKG